MAQIHLLWLKFHNHVVDQVAKRSPRRNPKMLCMEAREIVTHHYQYIVLNDFVKRFIDPVVYEDIIVGRNRKHLKFCCGEVPFMPLEFSVAAYRHGHSQVRETYDWNVNFNSRPGALADSPFRRLFEFSEVSGNFGERGATLPTNWVADHRRLFDFEEREFPHLSESEKGDLNMAKKIDPFLAGALGDLPELRHLVPNVLPSNNLAALNLRRGSMRRLPSGQDVSRELKNVKVLTENEMRSVIDTAFSETLENLEMFERTPLWLYILLEAAARGDGNKLGPLGSTVVAETFLTLVLTSRTSIIQGTSVWSPELDQELLDADEPLSSMPAILAWMDQLEAIVDPLQDQRIIASQQMM